MVETAEPNGITRGRRAVAAVIGASVVVVELVAGVSEEAAIVVAEFGNVPEVSTNAEA